MLETSARLLRLLSLLQSRRDWTGTELAGRLGVGLRTVRRDVDRLRDLGYPVDAAPGVAGGYRLGTGAALPPLLLDDEEAVAVAISLHTATTGSVAGLEETALRALTKLQQTLPSRRSSPTAGRLEAAGPDACILHTGSNSLDELALYVAVKGFDFQVLDPPELAGVLSALSERLRRAAGADPGQA